MMEKDILTGEKVHIRLMTNNDTDLIVKWRNNKRVSDNFIYREHFDRKTHENWIKNHIEKGDVVQFIICENETDKPVGSVYFRDIDRVADKRQAEYGIFIGEDSAIGKGYGNETALLAIRYAFDIMELDEIMLRVFKDNAPARKSYEHAGFKVCKELPKVECSDGTCKDMILMKIKRTEYE